MVGLGHRAEILPQPRRLRGRQRQRHRRLAGVQPQQPRRCRRRPQRPQRPGGMPAQVVEVGRAEGVAHRAGHLEPHQIGQQQVGAGGVHRLGQRQRRRQQRRAGVGFGDESHIVIVQGVGHRPVDERRLRGGGAETAPGDAGLGMAAQRLGVAAENFGQRLGGTGQHTADAIGDGGFGGGDGLRREILQPGGGDIFGNPLGQFHQHPPSAKRLRQIGIAARRTSSKSRRRHWRKLQLRIKN